jgi:hypothetical protein
MIFRVISGVIGVTILVGTVRLAQNLLGREFSVLRADWRVATKPEQSKQDTLRDGWPNDCRNRP